MIFQLANLILGIHFHRNSEKKNKSQISFYFLENSSVIFLKSFNIRSSSTKKKNIFFLYFPQISTENPFLIDFSLISIKFYKIWRFFSNFAPETSSHTPLLSKNQTSAIWQLMMPLIDRNNLPFPFFFCFLCCCEISEIGSWHSRQNDLSARIGRKKQYSIDAVWRRNFNSNFGAKNFKFWILNFLLTFRRFSAIFHHFCLFFIKFHRILLHFPLFPPNSIDFL